MKITRKYQSLAILIIACCLIPIACKTKQVTTHQQEQKTELGNRLIQQEESTQKNSVSSEDLDRQERLMTELIAKINLAFSGKSKDDKLLFELKRTIDGLVLQVSGTGSATYQQDERVNFEELEQRLYKRQDSVFTTLNLKLSDFELKLDHYFKEKDKQVKVKSSSLWVYLLIFAVLLFGFIIYKFGKRWNLM